MINSTGQVESGRGPGLEVQPSLNQAWFCVRTQSKREHIASAWLERQMSIEVFLPRIRFRRALPRGPVWFTEALFPNYLFARFELARWIEQIHCAPGVHGIVRFGAHCPTIPQEVIGNLRAALSPAGQARTIDESLQPGEMVQLTGGVFHGLEAIVTRVMPSQDRVAVLLDFLGRQTTVELASAAVTRVGEERWRVLRKAQDGQAV